MGRYERDTDLGGVGEGVNMIKIQSIEFSKN